MYTPAAFVLGEPASREVIVAASVGTLVITTPDGFEATVIPFVLDGDQLVGHVAKGNPIWKHAGPALVVFHGPHGYVSPGWYPTKAETGKVVPTWNYVTVMVHGTLLADADTDSKREIVRVLTDVHETRIDGSWQITDAPTDYIDQMLNGIVGIRVVIDRIEGKAKLSQNRPEPDQLGVIVGSADEAMTAAMVQARTTALPD